MKNQDKIISMLFIEALDNKKESLKNKKLHASIELVLLVQYSASLLSRIKAICNTTEENKEVKENEKR